MKCDRCGAEHAFHELRESGRWLNDPTLGYRGTQRKELVCQHCLPLARKVAEFLKKPLNH